MATSTVKSKKTANKNSSNRKNTAVTKKQATENTPLPIMAGGELQNIPVSSINFSPLNYRKFFSEAALNDFAAELALHGIISPLTVRKMLSGRYELVAGERRLRAALIAGFQEVPTVIKDLTDEEVIEIQLVENLQRENPHPMHEAYGIAQLKKAKKSIEDIAVRLGKSAKYVYSRLRFLDLIAPFQEIFLADRLNMQEAFDIASLSPASQTEFFEAQCADWKEKEDFKINNINYALSRFRYDLHRAPFDTKDKKLVPEAGACTNCPFNSATLKTLFPEMAKQAECTKKECYQSKCTTQLHGMLQTAFETHQPEAIVYYYTLSETLETMLDSMPGLDSLPRYSKNDITVIQAPVIPDKETYNSTNNRYDENEYIDEEDEYQDEEAYQGTEENDGEEDALPVFDEAGYNEALAEYADDLEEFNTLMQSGNFIKGLFVRETNAEFILFSLDAPKSNNRATVTAKEVQEAIKSGHATPELLQQEIDRLNYREERAKELDMEKVQLQVHEAFVAKTIYPDTVFSLHMEDMTAARLLVYQSLDYSARAKADKRLFSSDGDSAQEEISFFEKLQNLTDDQYSFMIRLAIGCKSDAKFPNNDTGRTVLQVAESAGVTVASIKKQQQEKADARKDKLTVRVADLNKRMELLQAKAGLEI